MPVQKSGASAPLNASRDRQQTPAEAAAMMRRPPFRKATRHAPDQRHSRNCAVCRRPGSCAGVLHGTVRPGDVHGRRPDGCAGRCPRAGAAAVPARGIGCGSTGAASRGRVHPVARCGRPSASLPGDPPASPSRTGPRISRVRVSRSRAGSIGRTAAPACISGIPTTIRSRSQPRACGRTPDPSGRSRRMATIRASDLPPPNPVPPEPDRDPDAPIPVEEPPTPIPVPPEPPPPAYA